MAQPSPILTASRALVPGLALCLVVAAGAWGLAALETRWLGRAWLEPLVLAILLGAAIRSLWAPHPRWGPGIGFCARTLLETAIVLLGATMSAGALLAVGAPLLAGIAGVVLVSLTGGFAIGRALGLPWRLATLIACGNSICGNSAIAAVAPVIEADAEDVAAAVAFTAALGVAVVLGLPVIASVLQMTPRASGVLAGLTVYAVPQVIAATAPLGAISTQVGAIVKLARVLMLGPIVLGLSLVRRRAGGKKAALPLHHLAPWFIIGFIALAAARSAGLIPQSAAAQAALLANWPTVVAMAGLGLGVDLRAVGRAGPRVVAVVTLSLGLLCGIALLLIGMLGLD